MITFHAVLKFVFGHILAGMAVILGILFVTFVCYIVGLASAPQGIDTPVSVIPEFLTLMFMAGVFAVTLSTCSFLISTFLVWLRSKRTFPVWFPPLVVSLLTFLVALGTKGMAFAALASGIAFVYFGIYWTLLTSSAALLDFFRRELSRPKAA